VKLQILFGQRHENYPGELTPEPLDIISEHGDDENPDWLNEREAFWKGVNEFVAFEIVTIDLGSAGWQTIVDRINGNNPAILGKVE